MKIHSNDWEMTLNNAHDPSAEYILIPIIHYEIALFKQLGVTVNLLCKHGGVGFDTMLIGF